MESSEEVAVAFVSYSGNGSSGVECDYAAAAAAAAAVATSFTKRKRTKHGLHTSSPPPPNDEDYFSTSTTATTTEEEEDMAQCLILLAQGRTAAGPSPSSLLPALPPREEKFSSRKFAETTTTATGAKAGFYVYECKTCNKCFPSFQALGGHRASHKKPKLLPAAAAADIDHHDGRLETISMNSAPLPPPPPSAPAAPNAKVCRVHECSICGSEFASGQALGGHMRRHRPVGAVVSAAAAPDSPPVINSSSTCKIKEEKKKCMLSLDLNLPAPSEEVNAMAAAVDVFAGFAVDQQRPLALVDCHY